MNGTRIKRGRRYSGQLRDVTFEWVRLKAIDEQRSFGAQVAHILEDAHFKEVKRQKQQRARAIPIVTAYRRQA